LVSGNTEEHSEDKNQVEKSLQNIIRSVSSENKFNGSSVTGYLLGLAEKGTLNTHQTSASVTRIADKMIKLIRGENLSEDSRD